MLAETNDFLYTRIEPLLSLVFVPITKENRNFIRLRVGELSVLNLTNKSNRSCCHHFVHFNTERSLIHCIIIMLQTFCECVKCSSIKTNDYRSATKEIE